MIQSGLMFATGGRLLLGDACCPEPGRIVGAEELPFITQLIHLPSYPSKPITLMMLCGLVYAILPRGRGNLQSGLLNPDPALSVSVAAQSPGAGRTGNRCSAECAWPLPELLSEKIALREGALEGV